MARCVSAWGSKRAIYYIPSINITVFRGNVPEDPQRLYTCVYEKKKKKKLVPNGRQRRGGSSGSSFRVYRVSHWEAVVVTSMCAFPPSIILFPGRNVSPRFFFDFFWFFKCSNIFYSKSRTCRHIPIQPCLQVNLVLNLMTRGAEAVEI